MAAPARHVERLHHHAKPMLVAALCWIPPVIAMAQAASTAKGAGRRRSLLGFVEALRPLHPLPVLREGSNMQEALGLYKDMVLWLNF